MSFLDMAIIVAVIALVVLAAARAMGVAAGRRDCCSGDRRDAVGDTRRVAVVDHDASHYPFEYDLDVRGMTCERCVSRVADALNALGGTWSDVDLASGRAHVRSKSELDAGALLAAVRDAGYEASLA